MNDGVRPSSACATRRARDRAQRRTRGFSLVEMLIALAISAALLVAVLSALVASFRAYQATTEQASTHVIGRVIMHRMMALVRNGVDFGPLPEDARDRFVLTDEFVFVDEDGREIALRLDRAASALLMQVDQSAEQLLLEGVRGPVDETGGAIGAFTLEFEQGTTLVRASFDLTVDADDNASVALEGDEVVPIRLVGSTAPRRLTW
jgi:prepilin-type N-terminal cleavage/methylation domain-containing protein